MIIYCDSGGKVTSVPSTLPFGSAPEIAIVSQKMAATAILKIKQPNQEYLPDIICTPEVGTDGMIYRAQLPQSVTNTHGRADYQVIFVLADGEQIGTYAGTFNVARGVPVDLPSSEEALRDYALAEVYQLLAGVAEVSLLADALNTYTGIGTVLETEAKNLAGAINELFARPIFRVDKTLKIDGYAADAKATGERIVKSIDDHNKDGNAHQGILEKLDDLDTVVVNVKSEVDTLKETTATDDEVALAVNEHNQAETAHPAIRSAITEVSNEVKKLNVEGKIADALFSHNTNDESHNDIRILLRELSDKVNHFLDVDDTKKDQLSELLALIDENIEDIENIVANNVKYNDIINNLTTNLDNKVLSAAQGVELKRLIEEVRSQISTAINAHNYDGNAHAGRIEAVDDLDTEVRDLKTKVTALENAKPNLEGYVTTAQFEAALGAYITDIDNIVGGGIEGANLITFTIEGTEYQAEEGMTWNAWCKSAYNTGGYTNADGAEAVYYDNKNYAVEYREADGNGILVEGQNLIVSGQAYYHWDMNSEETYSLTITNAGNSSHEFMFYGVDTDVYDDLQDLDYGETVTVDNVKNFVYCSCDYVFKRDNAVVNNCTIEWLNNSECKLYPTGDNASATLEVYD